MREWQGSEGEQSLVGAAALSLQSGLSSSSTGLQALIAAHYSANESKRSVTEKAGAGETGEGSKTHTHTEYKDTHTDTHKHTHGHIILTQASHKQRDRQTHRQIINTHTHSDRHTQEIQKHTYTQDKYTPNPQMDLHTIRLARRITCVQKRKDLLANTMPLLLMMT